MPRDQKKAGGSRNAPTTLEAQARLEERPLIDPKARGTGRPLPVSAIAPNPENLRDDALDSPEQREEMVNSLRTIGLIHAVVVAELAAYIEAFPHHAQTFPPEIRYVLLAGERRWLGARDAGWETIRGEVQNELLANMNEVFIHENLGRVDLNPFQEGEGYRRLQDGGLSLGDIATRNNKSKGHISKRIRLLDLHEDARAFVLSGELSIDTAYNLLAALGGNPELVVVAWQAMNAGGLSAKDAAQQALIASTAPSPPPAAPSAEELDSTDTSSGIPGGPSAEDPSSPSDGPTASGGQSTGNAAHLAGTRSTVVPEARAPRPRRPAIPLAGDDRERALAAEKRDKCCQTLIGTFENTGHSTVELRIATAVITTASAPALDRAHRWLLAHHDVGAQAMDAKAYGQTIAASGDPHQVTRLAYALALAHAEVRASDRRRQWDAATVAHVRHLIDAADYSPDSDWERQQLGLAPTTD